MTGCHDIRGKVMLLDHRGRGSRALSLLTGAGGSRALSLPTGPGGTVPARSPRTLGRRDTPGWVRTYTASLAVLEAMAATVASLAVLLTRPAGIDPAGSLFWAAAALVPGWPAVLGVLGAYSARGYGTGRDEYRRVGRAGFLLLALTGFVSYAMNLDLSRALVVIAIPALILGTALVRYAARCHL